MNILRRAGSQLIVLSIAVAIQGGSPAAFADATEKVDTTATEHASEHAAAHSEHPASHKEHSAGHNGTNTAHHAIEHKAHERKLQDKDRPEPVTAKIHISAPASIVWQVVHEERKHDPDLAYSKIISEGNNEFLLEQKFCLIPVIGTSVCQMQQKETPDSRIDYKLIKSDRFKIMEGSWVLIPSADKLSTTLELTTTLDLGMPIPHNVINHCTLKKLEKRLHNIKQMAEKECHHGSVAESKKDVI